ncbi:MAG: penicillin-binding protein 1C [Bacteroidia bacterium]|nr:penicillin-binding protein 1C [Bacteroidia bacterium]
MKFTLKTWSVKRKIVAGLSFALLLLYLFCLPKTLFKLPYSTVVTDRNGELLGARIAADGQWRFPHTGTTPSKVETCLLAFEDRHFYHHWGVNPVSTFRATYQNLKAHRIVSGGSTLTMQTIRLARNAPRTFGEKIIEMIWATRLEFRYSKKKILSLYLAHAPFGGNVVGLQAAAWRYFGHSPEELSWAEAAMLAVLPNAPATIHLGKGREALLAKRNKLLTYLYQEKQFDRSTYDLAISEPLPGAPHPLPQTAPYLVNHFYLKQPGKSYQSTINKGIQIQIEELADRWSNEFGRSDIRHLAILVIDVQRNEVVAYCGNVHYNHPQTGNQVDVIQAPRSTGSILKPFLYYAMLDEGDLLPHTLLPDIPININGFNPQNFSLQFEGAVPASEAIARSLNIPSVIMLQRYGVPKLHRLLQDIGLTTLHKPSSHYGLSLILGGAEATLWEVTQTYANMGRALEELPQTPSHLVVEPSQSETKSSTTDIFHKGAVWQTFEAIKEVNRPEEIDWKSIPSMQTIAWKTGTSYGFRDAWAVGVTARYAVGVWVGNATGEGKPGLVGARTAGPVLFDVFNLLPRSKWFNRPTNTFIEAEVCRKSGHLKGRFCEETDTMLILPAGLKTEACPYHHAVNLSADEHYRIYENCANTEPIIQRSWFTLPPVWEWYYKQHHPEYQSLPPFKKGCGEDQFTPMQFIYPSMNAHLKLPKQLDGSQGGITVEIAHSQSNATIYWHLDQTYLMQTEDFHKLTIQPSKGKHTLTAVDDSGNTISTTFFVE